MTAFEHEGNTAVTVTAVEVVGRLTAAKSRTAATIGYTVSANHHVAVQNH